MNHTHRAGRAFALLVLGATCIGFAPLLVRLSDVGPVASAFWRMALATPLLWLLAWQQADRSGARAAAGTGVGAAAGGGDGTPARSILGPSLLAGFFFAGDLAVWHFSILLTSVANSTLLANCAPIIVTAYAWLWLRQRPRPAFLLALLLAMGGATLLVGPNFRAGGPAMVGDLLGVVTSGFYSAYMICISRAQAQGSMLRLIAIMTTVSALLLLPIAWGLSAWQGQPFWPGSLHGWLVVLGLAVVTQSLGQGSITYALTYLPVGLSATTLLLQPMLSTLGAWLLFHERLGPAQLAGGVVLLAAIWLARRTSSRAASGSAPVHSRLDP